MKHLRTKTEAPFSGYLKLDQHELLCFSPERYLLKKDAVILSQPIKGTSAKSTNNVGQLRALQQNEKERAENVMIVDLVRNDLSRVASKGSVSVTELFGAYEFKSVNQLISTVRAELREGISNWDIIKASFPMGSMTGAPKVSAMMHAERYEKSAREIYSGAMGYVAPNGDFDLNVVIRSIALSHLTQKAVVHVGGAITILSDPSEEYKECLLKAEAIIPTSS
jgi:para-aminobenzoate synthetase component 1